MKKPATKMQALIEVAEALVALELLWNGDEERPDELLRLQRRAKKALKIPHGNPNITAIAEQGRAVRKQQADENAKGVQQAIKALRAGGYNTYRELADALNVAHHPAPAGGKWHAASVRKAEQREV